MKKRSIFISPILLAVISMIIALNYGCSDDFFNEKAGDRITPDQHYRTIEDASVSLRGAIIPLQDILPKLIILNGLRSDEMDVNPWSDAFLKDINEHILTGDENPFTNLADLYKVIININEVLVNLDRIGERDRNYDAIISHQIKGALIGMRAWTYLTISRLTGHAAYIEDNLTSLPSNLNQLHIPKNDLLDTLVNQLIPYIHDPLQTLYVEVRIPNYINNKALLGEIYLEKNDYENAVKYLKMGCESYLNLAALLKVDRTYQNAAWGSIFLNAESQGIENIAVIPYSSRENQNNPLANWFLYDYQVKPSNVLVDSFMVQEPAAGNPGDLWRGNGFSIVVDTVGQISEDSYLTHSYITKYALDINDPWSTDIIISRAADVHLMLAEALNRTGDPVSQTHALLLVNNGFNSVNPKPAAFTRWASNLGVRGRVYLKPRLVPESLTDEARMLYIEDLIIAERALELAFEGKRWNDLVRVANRRNDPEYLANKVAAKFEGTPQYDIVRNRLMNPENWYVR
jgi:starch-binding outer membrane protein, SusD/RagB family